MKIKSNTPVICSLLSLMAVGSASAASTVVARWTFDADFEFIDTTKQTFSPETDSTGGAPAMATAFIGDFANFDSNGGGGNLGFTSEVDGMNFAPSRTIKWDDLKGGGVDFDIGGITEFSVDKNDGAGPLPDDFGNDALIYLTLDSTNYQNLEIRFDVEGTPGDLPETFDLFYRIGGAGNTWQRDVDANNIGLTFQDFDPVDLENQFARSGQISLNGALDGASQVEIILNDFADLGNNEMEIDNIEISGDLVPEPSSALLILLSAGLVAGRRQRK